MTILEALVAILTSSLISSVLTYLTARKKQDATSEEKVRDTIFKILDQEREDNETCEQKVAALAVKVETLLIENAALKAQLSTLTDTCEQMRELLFAEYLKRSPA